MSVAFIACVEQGRLEEQTVLLCRSIRRYGGRYADAPIYTFQPRHGTTISHHTRTALHKLGAIHNTQPLNTAFPDYAIGNKIFVGAYAEKSLSHDVVIFLDSDTIVVGEPSELDLPNSLDGAVRPAYSRPLNSTGPGHPMDAYWQTVYDILGVGHKAFVETELGTRVRGYFSAGLVAFRPAAGLFQQWGADFLSLIKANHIPPSTGIQRMDEVALAGTVLRVFPRIRILDGRYNYLMYRRPQLTEPWRSAQLDQLVHIHYRDAFYRPGFLRSIQPGFDPASPVMGWLTQQLPLTPTISAIQGAR